MASARTVVVVGAGPVGCLAAISFAKHGWNVLLLEARSDLRAPSSHSQSQRSINLAISHRGLAALQAIDKQALEGFLECAIPMKGRMIHQLDGSLDSQIYDKDGQCINSIDRALLNQFLLNQAEALDNISILFQTKVQTIDFDKRTMFIFDNTSKGSRSVNFDFCVGADGSYSIVRRQMMKVVRMDYQQEYIPDEYLETRIPAGLDSNGQPSYLLDPNHLHIWPRHSFMLIALPNKDKSFTCTLFAPRSEFATFTDRSTVLAWFEHYFPDALSIIGRETVVADLLNNPRSPLICTKSNPYHYRDRAILLGDAAHSMVPFYGQGLNCGLEDVRILDALLTEREVQACHSNVEEDAILSSALAFYSENRHADLIAICDLAMDNYVEMRHKVLSPVYLFKRAVDNVLHSLTSRSKMSWESFYPILSKTPFPSDPSSALWLPLYTMVTFRPDISYATAKRRATRQSHVLSVAAWANAIILLGLGWRVLRLLQSQRRGRV